MATKAKRHIHKYRKLIVGGQKVWACALPDCNHYMPKHMESMVEGKNSYCWNCGNEIILDGRNMQNDMPICYDCESGKSVDKIVVPMDFDIDKVVGGK